MCICTKKHRSGYHKLGSRLVIENIAWGRPLGTEGVSGEGGKGGRRHEHDFLWSL